MTDVMRFSLERVEIAVEIDDDKYTLEEASGEAAERYRDATAEAMDMIDGKITKMRAWWSADAIRDATPED